MRFAIFLILLAVGIGMTGIKFVTSGGTATFAPKDAMALGNVCLAVSAGALVLGVVLVVVIARRRD